MSYAPSTTAGKQTAQQLADISRTLYERGWMPGTSGNISMRLPDEPGRALITASGRDKGELTARDVVEVAARTGRASRPGQDRPRRRPPSTRRSTASPEPAPSSTSTPRTPPSSPTVPLPGTLSPRYEWSASSCSRAWG